MSETTRNFYSAIREGESFHLIVLVSEEDIGRLSGTRLSLSKQSYSYVRLTYVAQKPVPAGFELSEKEKWLNIATDDFRGEANRLVSEGIDVDYLVFLDAGDVIEPHALMSVCSNFESHPAWCVAYADHDSLQFNGKFGSPFFKPDFEPDMLRAAPFVADGLMAVRRATFLELGGLKAASYGTERFELLLSAYEKFGQSGIGHISDVLCHRHIGNGIGAETKDDARDSRRNVLRAHLERIGAKADVKDGVLLGTFHISYQHSEEAGVSIIIPTLNGGAVLQGSVNEIVANTAYKNWELIVVDMESDDAETLAFLDYLRAFNNDAIRVISLPRSGNLPALLNAGAKIARQNYLLFLSDSTKPVHGDWLDEMLGYAVQSGVGVVGGKGIGQGDTISNADYILGLDGRPAVIPDLHAPLDAPGYFGRLQVPGNPSAVTSSCMLTEKKLFDELGGFDEQELAGGYSDVDYCLKVGQAGRRIVWTPFALMHQRHMTEPPGEIEADEEDDEVEEKRLWVLPGPAAQIMFDRWLDYIAFDPAYNRNLSLNTYSSHSAAKAFKIETLPALTWGADNHPEPCILALNGDKTGCGEYRIIAPLRALLNAGKVHGLNSATYLSIPELARMSPDIQVFQRPILEEHVKLTELYAHHSKAFRVYELDDLITNIQLSNQARHIVGGKDLIPRFRRALDVCDRMVVSTEYLAEEYHKFKGDIRVVPNYIERAKWEGLVPKRRQGLKPRVGWAGSNSHVGDLAFIADVVKALSDEVEWVFLGLCPDGVRNLVEYHSAVPIEHYPAKLASLNLDLAIAPLEDVPFNHAKSHLKLLEYGMLGYPVVCTDMTPYRGAYPVTRVKNRHKHWADAIREHVSDLDELAMRGDALRDFTKANWMLEDHLDAWLKAWLPD